MSSLLQHILLINLDSRPDRLIHAKNEFAKIGATFERFPAKKNAQGHIGCTLSHIHCLEIAKKREYPYVFIAEDDITFVEPALFLNHLRKVEENTSTEWDVLVVGGNNCPPFFPITDYLVRVCNIQTTTGYIVKAAYYNVLIENMKEGLGKLLREPENKSQYAIDIYWKQLQRTNMWVFCVPPSVIQYADYSDIEGRVVDYGSAMLDLEKQELVRRFIEQQKLAKSGGKMPMNLM